MLDKYKEIFSLILKEAPICAFLLDKKRKIDACNIYVYKVFGLPLDHSFNNEYISDFSPPQQKDGQLTTNFCKEQFRLAEERGIIRFEWQGVSTEGTLLPFKATVIKLGSNRQYCFIVFLRDFRALNYTIAMLDYFENIAYSDPLTGIYNRSYFMAESEKRLDDALASKKEFFVIMADIDFFKKINDAYGHLVGDEVLKILAARIRACFDNNAIVARYGGEEFIVSIINSNQKEAKEYAESVRLAVCDSPFNCLGLSLNISISVGLAEKGDYKILHKIIDAADAALYEAKKTGRNKTVFAST